eukprot:2251677-Pyramimonas_sp.AAC.1
MAIDGIAHATIALAAHGLTVFSLGEIDLLGRKADGITLLEQTKLMERWQSSESRRLTRRSR